MQHKIIRMLFYIIVTYHILLHLFSIIIVNKEAIFGTYHISK